MFGSDSLENNIERYISTGRNTVVFQNGFYKTNYQMLKFGGGYSYKGFRIGLNTNFTMAKSRVELSAIKYDGFDFVESYRYSTTLFYKAKFNYGANVGYTLDIGKVKATVSLAYDHVELQENRRDWETYSRTYLNDKGELRSSSSGEYIREPIEQFMKENIPIHLEWQWITSSIGLKYQW